MPDPDIIELFTQSLKLAERGPTRKRVGDKLGEFVATFIRESRRGGAVGSSR